MIEFVLFLVGSMIFWEVCCRYVFKEFWQQQAFLSAANMAVLIWSGEWLFLLLAALSLTLLYVELRQWRVVTKRIHIHVRSMWPITYEEEG